MKLQGTRRSAATSSTDHFGINILNVLELNTGMQRAPPCVRVRPLQLVATHNEASRWSWLLLGSELVAVRRGGDTRALLSCGLGGGGGTTPHSISELLNARSAMRASERRHEQGSVMLQSNMPQPNVMSPCSSKGGLRKAPANGAEASRWPFTHSCSDAPSLTPATWYHAFGVAMCADCTATCWCRAFKSSPAKASSKKVRCGVSLR
mmetsp:Transcript_38280/g.93002  ORF Transcript_38280/g.93002 Transcript_38280/m.93002 type:complete len:207 (+) Transcript_38280:115-735(+)